MKIIRLLVIVLFTGSLLQCKTSSNNLYQYNPDSSPRWIAFENKSGTKGRGGIENNGAKGHPCDHIPAHQTIELMNYNGTGIINRIWLTINDRSASMCRSLVIRMYWDGDKKPAVSAPIGDFFGQGFERKKAFENELFSSGEGRSFLSFVPMPFKTHARIEMTNESEKDLDMIFYDIDLQRLSRWDEQNLYFHGYWHRDTATTLAKDFQILPLVRGKGRYLGTNISVIDNPVFGRSWFGEGEVKMYIDGDSAFPTLAGTGTEDYIGTAWGQGIFQSRNSGCLIGGDSTRHWAFYRYHVPDPIFFHQNFMSSIQQIGGNSKDKVQEMMDRHLPLIPITVHKAPVFIHLYKPGQTVNLKDPALPDGWVNFYRVDDVAAMAYFYLDKPSDDLPALQSREIRTYKLN